MKLSGSHGTCSDSAKSIDRHGFRSSGGRLGTGVYFWAREEFQHQLALGWINVRRHAGKIRRRAESVIYFVNIEVEELDVLNIEHKIKTGIYKLAEQHGLDFDDNRHVTMIFDKFVKAIEKKKGSKFKILTGEVYGPRIKEYPVKILGNPLCHAVRDVGIIKETKKEVVL